jgi:hypothetical protein
MFKIPQAELWPTPPEVPRLTNKHLKQKLGEEGKKLVFTVTKHGDVTFTQSKSVRGWRGWQTKCQCSGVRNLEKWNKWIKQQTGGLYIIHCVNPRKKDMGATSLTQRLDETQKLSRGRVICRVKVSWRMGWKSWRDTTNAHASSFSWVESTIQFKCLPNDLTHKKNGISALWTKTRRYQCSLKATFRSHLGLTQRSADLPCALF